MDSLGRDTLYYNEELHFIKNCPYKSSALHGQMGLAPTCPKCKANPSPDVRCAKCGLLKCVCNRSGGGVPDAADRFAEYDQEHYQRGRRKRRKSKKRKSKKRKSHKRKSHKRKSTKVKRSRMRYSRKKRSGIKQFGGVSKEDFQVTHFLASGNNGEIHRVTFQGPREIKVYVMKSLEKKRGDKEQQIKEANILKELHGTPFVVNLHYTFQQDNGLYMIMDFLSGGELMSAIMEDLLQPINQKICAAQIFSALDHMHGKKILHGDIKPENICFKHNGDAYLVDFGHASKVDDSGCCRKNKTGTIHYLAPEAFEDGKREYGWAIDCWAMGCVIYAMVERCFPFPGGAEIKNLTAEWWEYTSVQKKQKLARKILAEEKKFFTLIKQGKFAPFRSSDTETQELINGLLNKQSTNRLTAKEAMKSSWFSVSPEIDWTKLSYDVNGYKFIDLSADPLNKKNFPQIKITSDMPNYTGEGDHYEDWDWDWDAPEQKLQKSRERAEGLEVEQGIRQDKISELEKKAADLLAISRLPEDELKEWKTKREIKEREKKEREKKEREKKEREIKEREIKEGEKKERETKEREKKEREKQEREIKKALIKRARALGLQDSATEEEIAEAEEIAEEISREQKLPPVNKCSNCNIDVSLPENEGDSPLVQQEAAVVSGKVEWWCQFCLQ